MGLSDGSSARTRTSPDTEMEKVLESHSEERRQRKRRNFAGEVFKKAKPLDRHLIGTQLPKSWKIMINQSSQAKLVMANETLLTLTQSFPPFLSLILARPLRHFAKHQIFYNFDRVVENFWDRTKCGSDYQQSVLLLKQVWPWSISSFSF